MAESSGFANIVSALKQPNYGPYAIGNFVSVNGAWVQRLGVAWLTWELTESPGWLGAVAFASLAPMALLAPLAGVAADRWKPIVLIQITNWLIALQALALLALMWTGWINEWWVLGLTALLGVLMAANQPARLSVVPQLVGKEHLTAAIAVSSLSYNGATFIGPALFAFLIPWLGVESTFVFQALTFTLFGIMLTRTNPRDDAAGGRKKGGGLFSDLRDGLHYSWNHVAIMPLMVLLTVIALGTKPISDLFAGYADDMFGRGADGLGILTSALGLGAVMGVFWLAGRKNTKGLVTACLLFAPVTCLANVIFIATDIFWVAAAAAVLLGVSIMPCAVGAQTLMQTGIDPAMRGRVMALYVALWRALPALGALVMGYAAEFVGLRWPPVAGAVLVLAATLWIWRRRRAVADAIETAPEETRV